MFIFMLLYYVRPPPQRRGTRRAIDSSHVNTKLKFAPRFLFLLLTAGSLLRANNLTGLTDTGVSGGSVITSGLTDPTWSVSGPYNLNTIAATVGNLAWANSTPTSQWIYDSVDSEGSNSYFDYYTSFTIAAGSQATASITGEYMVDNSLVNVFLNGVALNISNSGETADGNAGNFEAFVSFTIPVGADFQAGTNTLEFETFNGTGPAGLNVQMSGTASAVPDVSSTAGLLGVGFLFLGLAWMRNRASRTS